MYANDIILTGNHVEEITHIVALLYSEFCIKNLGDLTYFLGFEVAHNLHGLNLNKKNIYTLDLFHDIGMLNFSLALTPMA